MSQSPKERSRLWKPGDSLMTITENIVTRATREIRKMLPGSPTMEPLEQAQEIQNLGRRRERRHNNRRPTQVKRPFVTTSPLQQAYDKRCRTSQHPPKRKETSAVNRSRTSQQLPEQKGYSAVDLCDSNSDTESDSYKRRTPQTERKSNSASLRGKKRLRENPKEGIPVYNPSSKFNSPVQDRSDNENEGNCSSSRGVYLQEKAEVNGDCRKQCERKKKRKVPRGGLESHAASFREEIQELKSKTKHETTRSETSSELCNGEIEDRVPRKKISCTQSVPGSSQINVPALKSSVHQSKRRKRQKHTTDVKGMGDGWDDGYGDDGPTTHYLEGMKHALNRVDKDNVYNADSTSHNSSDIIKDVINSAGSPANNNTVQNVDSTFPTSPEIIKDFVNSAGNPANNNEVCDVDSISSNRATSASTNLPSHGETRSTSTIFLKKVNNGIGSKPKTRRVKPKSTKIVPGASLKKTNHQQQQNELQSQWRNEKDQDEYHISKKEAIDDAVHWDPYKGENYPNTPGIMTRRSRRQFRTRIGKSKDPEECSMPPPRRSKRTKKQKEPKIIDISSDSEDENVEVTEKVECDINEFRLKRLVIGKKVFNNHDHQPRISFNESEPTMEIAYLKAKGLNDLENISVRMPSIEDFGYWARGDGVTKDHYDDLDSFICMRSDVIMKSLSRRKGSNSTKSIEIVLEFEEDQHMNDVVEIVGDQIKTEPIPPDDVDINAASLLSDSKRKYKLRSKVTPHKKDSFIANKKSDEILLVYPFEIDRNKLENAADGLKELAWSEKEENENFVEPESDAKSDPATSNADNESSENALTTTQSGQRSHFIEIRAEDYEKLDTGQWLNDSLVDMWMQWISRHITCKQSSNVHFFTSHFYTTLTSEGVNGVKSWTAKKNIDIFEKRLIFIPINKTLHWSLCVVVNPGAIIPQLEDEDEDQLLPCILFFDSLNMHRKSRVHKFVLKWLNSEWKRTKDANSEPFTRQSCVIHDPPVPRQNNGSDCGVFVCRYAFAMFQLRHLKFTRQDAGLEPLDNDQNTSKRKSRSQAFRNIITNGKEFDFNVDDIQRIRRDFKTLIRGLHPLYQTAKQDRIKAEKQEKRAKKRRREKATKELELANIMKREAAAKASSVPPATSNLDGAHDGATNDLSDSSSKENFIPKNEEEKLATKTQEPSADGRDQQATREDVLISEALREQCSIGAPPIRTDDEPSGLHTPKSGDDWGGSLAAHNDERIDQEEQEEALIPTSLVDKEEMADNDNLVHL